MAKPNYVILPDGGIAFINGNGGGGGGTVAHVTPLASGEAEVSPVGSNVYVVDGEIDTLKLAGFAVDSAEVWTVLFKFSASAAATVQIVPPLGTLSYDTVGDFTFEAGKAYVISCQYGMLVRGERTEVVI